jgi:hypothetical protein
MNLFSIEYIYGGWKVIKINFFLREVHNSWTWKSYLWKYEKWIPIR